MNTSTGYAGGCVHLWEGNRLFNRIRAIDEAYRAVHALGQSGVVIVGLRRLNQQLRAGQQGIQILVDRAGQLGYAIRIEGDKAVGQRLRARPPACSRRQSKQASHP